MMCLLLLLLPLRGIVEQNWLSVSVSKGSSIAPVPETEATEGFRPKMLI